VESKMMLGARCHCLEGEDQKSENQERQMKRRVFWHGKYCFQLAINLMTIILACSNTKKWAVLLFSTAKRDPMAFEQHASH
jgi:hypothetical protein